MNPSGNEVIHCREQGQRDLPRLKSYCLWWLRRQSLVLLLLDIMQWDEGYFFY